MFGVIESLSWPGSPEKANEDACGTAGAFAWVIDTSIFPGTPAILHPSSDAAWFAGFANERLKLLAPTYDDGVALVGRVMSDARRAFDAAAPVERRDPVTWPVGAMTLVRRHSDRADVWSFADTTAYFLSPDGVAMTVGEGPELRRLEAAKAAELLMASGATPHGIGDTVVFQTWLRERRERLKNGRGAALLGLHPEAAAMMRHQSVECPSGTVVLLTSDGFSALVDLYGYADAAGILRSALQSGLEPLAREARRIETEVDPSGTLYPRFKESDDTTALLLKAL